MTETALRIATGELPMPAVEHATQLPVWPLFVAWAACGLLWIGCKR